MRLKTAARHFSDTPTGRKCAQQLGELLADAKIRTVVEDEEQRRFIAAALQSAEQYRRYGLS